MMILWNEEGIKPITRLIKAQERKTGASALQHPTINYIAWSQVFFFCFFSPCFMSDIIMTLMHYELAHNTSLFSL